MLLDSHPLRPFQKEALSTLKKKQAHLICVSATGSGKSRIYEIHAAKVGRKTLIVSPLIALARQQAVKLESLGLNVLLTAGSSTHSEFSKNGITPSILRSNVWIASPEQLAHPHYVRQFHDWKPDFLVVDECHCLWDWGDRFRPSFQKLPELTRLGSIPQSLWLTATLPQPARAELRSQLSAPVIEQGSFSLPENLFLEVAKVSWNERMEFLLRWINQREGAGIIFSPTRDFTARITRVLKSVGKNAESYHAGLSREERLTIEKKVRAKAIDILVATSAFGMGMDHEHLRWVALWQTPTSLLQLAQSLGRAGRHLSKSAQALVLWSPEDFKFLNYLLQNSERLRTEAASSLTFLESPLCRRQSLKSYFEPTDQLRPIESCELCDRCNSLK